MEAVCARPMPMPCRSFCLMSYSKKANKQSLPAGLQFSHLHLHTSYSLLDGAIRIQDLMKRVKETGMNSVAMTDHGNMFGAIEFYKAASKEGVRPIIGCEFYIAPGGRREKANIESLADGNNYHLILLAQNKTGYRNLIHLASRSYSEGFYRKPRIDYPLLSEHSQGLVCLTACLGGEVQQKILTNRRKEAAALAGKLKEIFGKERFYLEIQNHGLAEEEIAAQGNYEIAKQEGIELCLSNDCHFLDRNDHAAQDTLLRINQKKSVDDPLAFSFNQEFYLKSPEEMWRLFPELPQAFHNTQVIADMIDLNFEFGNPLLPRFQVPEGETLDSYLHKLAYEGLQSRYPQITQEVQKRFDYEYNTIKKMDFSGYFLIVQDFINFAKRLGIPVGPGRGSAAGSIISYCLGITDIDPLRYGLLFERFLNPDRNEMPDIDIDFCTEGRESVIQYVRDKYGSEQVGQIITYGKMAARACLKDVARVLNIPFAEANHMSQMFPDVLNLSIEEAIQSSQELKEYSQKGEIQKKLFQIALRLEGNVRHTGVHAAGIVIAPQPLEEILPMATVASGNSGKNKERILVSQYDMQSLADVGLVKMDFLGLRNLTVIHKTIESIRKRTGEEVKLDCQYMEDPQTYKFLQKAQLAGIFQLESSPGMKELVIRMKPECFEDLVALIALFRPGPLQSGMADAYVNRKKGREKVHYAHPDLKEILASTYGVILYQEQVMQIAQKIGGFLPSEADGLRKAMGKKIKEKMEAMRAKFLEGAHAKAYSQAFAAELYEQMAQFASYGFNKSHSVAYACIVYQTAFLKTHYTTDYMCAVLNSEIAKTERLVPYINACHAMKIKILGPDINTSQADFSVEKDKRIRFGLAGIKNVGSAAVEYILERRKMQGAKAFHSFFHFMENLDNKFLNKRMIESLNQSGAFLSLGYKRKSIQESIELGILHAQRFQSDRVSGQSSLFASIDAPQSQIEPIPRSDDAAEFSSEMILQMERTMLGFYLSGHPLAKYERKLRHSHIPTLEELQSLPDKKKKVEVAAILADFSIRLTRSSKEICHLVLEDMTGHCAAILFPNTLEKIRQKLQKEAIYFIQADLEKKVETGTLSLLVQEMRLLDEALIEEKQEKSLHIKLIPDESRDMAVIGELKSALSHAKGPLQVYFHILDKNKSLRQVIRAHKSFGIRYSNDLLDRLSQIQSVYSIDLAIGEQIRNRYQAPVLQ